MLCKWIFIGFNVLMLWAVIYGVYSASRMEAASEAERAGRAVGTAIGVGIILAIWAAGSLILGLLVYFTKPKAAVRASQPVRPSIEGLKPIDEVQRAQAPESPVSGATHQAPDPSVIGEPLWTTRPGGARSIAILGERHGSEHGFGTDPREHGGAATKPTRSFFLWLLIGILGGAGVVYGVLGPPGNSATSKAADAPTSSSALDPCADLGGFHICVDHAVQRRSLSDGFSTTTAGGDQTFVLVRVTLSSTRKETADLAWPMFELRDSSRRKWEPDIRSQTTASIGGYSTLDFQQLHPDTAITGWLVYYVPTSAVSDLHLRFQPGLVRSVDLALPGAADGATCTLGGKTGVCIDVAKCTGTHSAGLCDGPANVQCCVQ
jgi:hypothetical protein